MTRTAVSTPAVPDERELVDFVLQLGRALTEAGSPVSEIQERLVLVLAAYGVQDARVVVLPTSVLISLGTAGAATIERTQTVGASLRLDQIAALYDLVREGERGELSPAEGIERMAEIRAMPARFGLPVSVFGYVVGAVGICLVLEPSPKDLGVAAALGAIVAVVKLVARDRAWLQVLLPAAAALMVSAAIFFAAEHGLVDATLRPLIASLVTLLPGAALTTATVELASGEMIAGASRLVYGGLQLSLLAFGIVAGAALAGLPGEEAAFDDPSADLLGWWAPWVGVAVFGVGMFLHFSAPRRSLPWLLAVLYAGWIGQVVGDQLFGGTLSGFVGALAMTPVAYVVATRPTGPPATVTFLPAFWLLVPGALGLIGVTEIATENDLGAQDFVQAIGTIISIALGVLCGVTLYRNAVGVPQRFLRLARRSGDEV